MSASDHVVLRCQRDRTRWLITSTHGDHQLHIRSLASLMGAPAKVLATLLGPEGTGRVDNVRIEVVVDDDTAHAVTEAKTTRDLAQQYQDQAAVAARTAARRLTSSGFSTSDAAAALGLSRQRVHQLLEAEDPQPTGRARSSEGLDVVAEGDLD